MKGVCMLGFVVEKDVKNYIPPFCCLYLYDLEVLDFLCCPVKKSVWSSVAYYLTKHAGVFSKNNREPNGQKWAIVTDMIRNCFCVS